MTRVRACLLFDLVVLGAVETGVLTDGVLTVVLVESDFDFFPCEGEDFSVFDESVEDFFSFEGVDFLDSAGDDCFVDRAVAFFRMREGTFFEFDLVTDAIITRWTCEARSFGRWGTEMFSVFRMDFACDAMSAKRGLKSSFGILLSMGAAGRCLPGNRSSNQGALESVVEKTEGSLDLRVLVIISTDEAAGGFGDGEVLFLVLGGRRDG